MNNTTLIKELTNINTLFYEDYGVNKSNQGFNLLTKLINDLREETLIKGFKGSEKLRIKEAFAYQKETMKSRRPILALCDYKNGYQFIGNATWFCRLPSRKEIKGLVSTSDTYTYSDKKHWHSFDPESSKASYPNVEGIFKPSAYNKSVIINAKKLLDKLESLKDKGLIALKLGEIKVLFEPKTLKRALIIGDHYDSDMLEVKYNEPNKPVYFADDTIVAPMRTYHDEMADQYELIDVEVK